MACDALQGSDAQLVAFGLCHVMRRFAATATTKKKQTTHENDERPRPRLRTFLILDENDVETVQHREQMMNAKII